MPTFSDWYTLERQHIIASAAVSPYCAGWVWIYSGFNPASYRSYSANPGRLGEFTANDSFASIGAVRIAAMANEREMVEQLFEAALALDGSERAALLDHACRANASLRQQVDELLLEDAIAGSFLEHPPAERLDQTPRSPDHAISPTHSLDSTGDNLEVKTAGRFKPGDVLLDRFVILRFVAMGGMGEVYEVEDLFLQGVHLALKTIRVELASDPALQQRFEHEVLVARQVTHVNLCPIYDIFRCESPAPRFLFLTMKFLPGDTLAQRLRTGMPPPADEALAILRQMIAGLNAIHGAGIVHRDIKPNNIILEGNGPNLRLSITDFGLARAFESEISISGQWIVAGTPAYMAPELFLGQTPSQATDLFALGVVLHEVFAGHKPIAAQDNVTVTVSSKLSSLKVPSFCSQLIIALLDKAPARRCHGFEHALHMLHLRRRTPETWTRRRFATAAAASTIALAGGAWWKRDRLEDALHPLPRKRFVALLNWPATSDRLIAPMLTSVLTAIQHELARAETFDHDLFAISPEDVKMNVTAATPLKDVCDSVGANLVLAASALPKTENFHLFLRVLDPKSGQPLREKQLSCPVAEITSLPGRAVRVADSLFDLHPDAKENERMESGTNSVEAFTAFHSAETFMNQADDSALEAAIQEYKQAIDLDSHYAIAHARLARAYCRLYQLKRDPAALELAQGNCQLALKLGPNLVESHLAATAILDETGELEEALQELGKALAMDPSNARTLVWQGQLLNRLNRWQDAEKALRRALSDHPNYWLAWNELGFGFHAQARFREAMHAFRTASLAAPMRSTTLANLAQEYMQIDDFDAAAEALKRSLASDPELDEAALSMSLLLRYLRKPDDALPYARKAAALNPADDINWLELADCHSSLPNQQKEARDAFLQARRQGEHLISIEPTNGPGRMLLALYKVKTGDGHEATSLISEAEKNAADDIDSQLYKARVLELIGERNQALAVLAVCFRRGAGDTQFRIFPDMDSLRQDPRYRHLLSRGNTVIAETAS